MEMLNQSKKPNRKLAEQAITSLKDLLVSDMLIEKSKQVLNIFTKNPLVLKHS
jgi:uncharacterized membrane protein affecting hemolysin expression